MNGTSMDVNKHPHTTPLNALQVKLASIPKWLRIALLLVVAFLAFFVLPFTSWLIADEGLNRTAHADFCAQCHSMIPFWASYQQDIHGGNTPFGFQASCTNCHLDNSSSSAYFYSKATKGLHDLWVETFGDPDNIDWEAMRSRRQEYTFDSGCLSCHNNLLKATQKNSKAFLPHREYFAGRTDKQCVSCHKHVGHKNMSDYYIQKP